MERIKLDEIQTALYIPVSRLFAGKWEAYETFTSWDNPFSWGENDRTLINTDTILHSLNRLFEDIDDREANFDVLKDIQEVIHELERLEERHVDTLYIDMEC